MSLTREEKIPYNVIQAYADRNNDLQIKLEAASKLQTAEDVLNYVRNLKFKDGKVDQHAQFLILATHKETIKKYPYLNDYLNTEGDDIFGHSDWSTVRRGMEHEQSVLGELAVPVLFAVSIYLTSKAAASAKKVFSGESFESPYGIMRDAILGGLAFYGAKACARLVTQEVQAVDNLQESLGFKR